MDKETFYIMYSSMSLLGLFLCGVYGDDPTNPYRMPIMCIIIVMMAIVLEMPDKL